MDKYMVLVGPFVDWKVVAMDKYMVLVGPFVDWKVVAVKLEEVVGY
jgi:hypothetical protein